MFISRWHSSSTLSEMSPCHWKSFDNLQIIYKEYSHFCKSWTYTVLCSPRIAVKCPWNRVRSRLRPLLYLMDFCVTCCPLKRKDEERILIIRLVDCREHSHYLPSVVSCKIYRSVYSCKILFFVKGIMQTRLERISFWLQKSFQDSV
jgi:hypothetical protein